MNKNLKIFTTNIEQEAIDQIDELLNQETFKDSMKDVYTTSVNESTIDESPFVYKPMQEIIDRIDDTVDIIKLIKPIYNFKASD